MASVTDSLIRIRPRTRESELRVPSTGVQRRVGSLLDLVEQCSLAAGVAAGLTLDGGSDGRGIEAVGELQTLDFGGDFRSGISDSTPARDVRVVPTSLSRLTDFFIGECRGATLLRP